MKCNWCLLFGLFGFVAVVPAQQLVSPRLTGYDLIAAVDVAPAAAATASPNADSAEPVHPEVITPIALQPIIKSQNEPPPSFQWHSALKQSGIFLGMQHTWRLTQSKTRRNLRGPFFHDWVGSAANINGWGDGDNFATNYIGHPIEGAISGFIQIQNDPQGIRQVFDVHSKDYWQSRLKALGWAAAYSTQFEIGPASEATIGHVGLDGKTAGAVDLVITPSVGFAWIVGEDALDKHLVRKWEGPDGSFRQKFVRVALNPNRSFANLLRWKAPWYRDTRGLAADTVISSDDGAE